MEKRRFGGWHYGVIKGAYSISIPSLSVFYLTSMSFLLSKLDIRGLLDIRGNIGKMTQAQIMTRKTNQGNVTGQEAGRCVRCFT